MTKPVVISARVDEATAALLDKIAAAQGRSRASLVSRAVAESVAREAAFMDFVQVGIDDFEAGRFVTHEEFVAEIMERQRQRRSRAA